MTDVLLRECANLAGNNNLPWHSFEDKTIVVTGATGLIGTTLVGSLLEHEHENPTGLRVVALVRNTKKAHKLFGICDALQVLHWDATRPFDGLDAVVDADVIFHCANMTESKSFVETPVDVIRTTVDGAQAMLSLAQRTNARLCLLSTMETYGEVFDNREVQEDQGGFLDPMLVRNSYPEAKRLDEALCAAYASQYGTDALVVRLVQTFGPGVPQTDNRVFAYFGRCVKNGKDIVLLTDGTKQNSYLYTSDAVSALLVAAAYGVSGRAYNAANDDTFCSIRQMAQMVVERFGHDGITVRIEADEQAALQFRKGNVLRLDTSALRALGWQPTVGLAAMYERMIADWNESDDARQ